ncbi:MAG: Xaa-Pro peptidase family protein [bacterium]|nr:Xaa-Pro peptidase family protein [bacterium]
MRERILRLRAELLKMDCDAFLVTNPVKVRYLTGFNSNESSFCLVTQQGLYLVVHKIYGEQATLEAGDTEILTVDRPQDEISKIRELFKPYRKVCFENDLSYIEYRLLRERRAKEDFFPVTGDSRGLLMKIGLVDIISAVKDDGEIQKIQKAVEITEKVLKDHVLPKVRPGVTEKNLAAEVSYWGSKLGAEGVVFDNTVLFGKRSSMPHGEVSNNRLQEGDIVQFDLSHSVDGLLSDVSRVFILGEPTEKQSKIYNLVLTAQEAAIKAARPGIKCKDLDKIARDIIKNGGYDIPHALGHGLGISMDTFPGVGSEDETELMPGHVITIEPGIYIPGWGGIRIEDVIVITEDGCRNLNKFPKDLTVIPISEKNKTYDKKDETYNPVKGRPFTVRAFD